MAHLNNAIQDSDEKELRLAFKYITQEYVVLHMKILNLQLCLTFHVLPCYHRRPNSHSYSQSVNNLHITTGRRGKMEEGRAVNALCFQRYWLYALKLLLRYAQLTVHVYACLYNACAVQYTYR